jgi:serine/threonine protein kinase
VPIPARSQFSQVVDL